MTLREQIERPRKQFEAFNRWEAENIAPRRDLAAVLADLSAIWRRLPQDVRSTDPDPEKLGVQRMHRVLALLARRR